MNNLACNQLLLGSTTLWSVDFNLDLGFKDICTLISVLYYHLYLFFLSFMFVINMNLWVLMDKMIG